jgi:protein subunit release factor A
MEPKGEGMKELLFSVTKKDLNITYFSGTGKGGQHRNKHQNCVRINHKESGVIVTGQTGRDRKQNEREAFRNLIKHPDFKHWMRQRTNLSNEVIKKVEEYMRPGNLRIEGRSLGEWVRL